MDIGIITTSSLPWMTGTSINPLFRACYLSNHGPVTLYLPWVRSQRAQKKIFPAGLSFQQPSEQVQWILQFLQDQGFKNFPKIVLYPAFYLSQLGSMFPRSNLTKIFHGCQHSTVILEEPEHLCLFQPRSLIRKKIPYVLGISQTEYGAYVQHTLPKVVEHASQKWTRKYTTYVSRRVTHKCLGLSPVLSASHMTIVNVNGVNDRYFSVAPPTGTATKGYFLGKLVEEKGLLGLASALAGRGASLAPVTVDIYGSGADEKLIKRFATKKKAPFFFQGSLFKNQWETLAPYHFFVNPSQSEVLCTTTAEALAMGKFVIIPKHPSNTFFFDFKNCLTYASDKEFYDALEYVQHHRPEADDRIRQLSWNAAVQRLWPYLEGPAI